MPTVLTPEGVYEALVESHDMSKAKTGNPQWIAKIKVFARVKNMDKLSAGSDQLEKPLNRTVYEPLTENTTNAFAGKLESVGLTPVNFESLFADDPAYLSIAGNRVYVRCSHNEYNGRVNEKWQIARQEDRPVLTVEERERIKALYGDKFKKTPF